MVMVYRVKGDVYQDETAVKGEGLQDDNLR